MRAPQGSTAGMNRRGSQQLEPQFPNSWRKLCQHHQFVFAPTPYHPGLEPASAGAFSFYVQKKNEN
jgi:hypothetical protein